MRPLLLASLSIALLARASASSSPFRFSPMPGLEPSVTVMRRDPSDIVKIAGRYYLWYTRGAKADGYDATIWYATSEDGRTWSERGESLARGGAGAWDEQSVFTPNILIAEGRYWLFFTGVPNPFTNAGNRVTKSALGLAVASSPEGPWCKLPKNPVLRCADDPAEFDSMRVDDACLVTRDGNYWLYYKGRQWNDTPQHTKMGVAIASRPEGPYRKFSGNPVIAGGHEVLVWPWGKGVVALINLGPPGLNHTLQYSPDGLTFSKLLDLATVPAAPGAYRPDAFTDRGAGEMIAWGVCLGQRAGSLPFLQRFDCSWGSGSAAK